MKGGEGVAIHSSPLFITMGGECGLRASLYIYFSSNKQLKSVYSDLK